MIPIVEDFVKRFNLEDFVIVADSGLMNKTNITTLKIRLPKSGESLTKTMLLTEKHKTIEPLFDKIFWGKF